MRITVLNASPVVLAGLNKSAQEGEGVPLVATFTDAGAEAVPPAQLQDLAT